MEASEVSRCGCCRDVRPSPRSAWPSTTQSFLHNSNKLTLRLLPCDVVARVAPAAQQVAQFEVDLAQQLVALECPVAALEPRVEPRVYERDDFVITLWTYYQPVRGASLTVDYANALGQLTRRHADARCPTPHFTDRVDEAQQLGKRHQTPELPDADRELSATR